jgi:hypothetical protein
VAPLIPARPSEGERSGCGADGDGQVQQAANPEDDHPRISADDRAGDHRDVEHLLERLPLGAEHRDKAIVRDCL